MSAAASQTINVDNQAHFRYSDDYCFRLMEASAYCALTDFGTQLSVFHSSALKKQLPIKEDKK
jgi:hypothetical protein